MSGAFSSAKPATTPPPQKIGQITPTGTSLFGTTDPTTGEFIETPGQEIQKTTESEFAQQFRQGTEGIQLGVLGQLGDPLQEVRGSDVTRGIIPSAQRTAEGVPTLGEGLGQRGLGGAEGIDRLEQATFEGVARRVAPEFEQQRERLAQQLADQGIPIGSEAFERELTRQETAQGEVLTRAGLDAVQAGRAESERQSRLGLSQRVQLFGEQVQTRGQLEQERRNQLQDSLQRQNFLFQQEQQKRAQQFGELGALGGFISPFQASPIGALSAGQTGATPAGGGFQILGAAAGAASAAAVSDIRLKENIELVGVESGHNIYEFDYINKIYGDGRFRGVMAQDVEKIKPEAVTTMDDGFKAVFYDMIGLKMEAV